MTDDLFGGSPPRKSPPPPTGKTPPAKGPNDEYNASSIEVLEGLEPVRRRPGMYIGGTDSNAMHHLFAEVEWSDDPDWMIDEKILEHALRTGSTIPWEDVEPWLRSWGKPDELPRPKWRK